MSPIMNFETACRELGIPSDRVGLVKRNVELKGKLNAALSALMVFQEAHHDAYKHTDARESCTRNVCAGMLKIVRDLRAS